MKVVLTVAVVFALVACATAEATSEEESACIGSWNNLKSHLRLRMMGEAWNSLNRTERLNLLRLINKDRSDMGSLAELKKLTGLEDDEANDDSEEHNCVLHLLKNKDSKAKVTTMNRIFKQVGNQIQDAIADEFKNFAADLEEEE